ncbi:MAG: LPP20 family lipoprotein [Planctomycetes bacterium]|nr:LPP20 family lipoprotein [Planctomycetota bacterium]
MRAPIIAMWFGLIAATMSVIACQDQPRTPAASASASASAVAAPAWVTTTPTSPGMLFAVGSAARGDRERAIAAARSELASGIEITIASERDERDTSHRSGDDTGLRTERYDRDTRSQVRLRVAQERLPGVVVRETADLDDRTAALVAMDRSAWAAGLRARIDEVDARLSALAAHSSDGDADAPPAAAAARLYQRILPIAIEREEIAARLRVADPAASVPASPVVVAQMRADLLRVLAQVAIAIASQAGSEALRPLANEACANQGLRVEPSTELAQLVVRIDLAQEATRIEREFRADGSVRADILEPSSGRVLGSLTLSERASALDETTARKRLLEKLARHLATDLDQHLLACIARW